MGPGYTMLLPWDITIIRLTRKIVKSTVRIKTHENEVISSINIKRSLNFWEFNSTFHCSELKYFKVFLVLRVRGKLFQSLAVLTAKGRPPSKVFCGGGTGDLNYNFWWSLRGYLSFFLWMCLNSEAVFHLSFWKQAHRIDVCFIVKREPA